MMNERELHDRCDSLLNEYQTVTAELTLLNGRKPELAAKHVSNDEHRRWITAKLQHAQQRTQLIKRKNEVVRAMRQARADLHALRSYGPNSGHLSPPDSELRDSGEIGQIDPVRAELLLRRALSALLACGADEILIAEIRDYCNGKEVLLIPKINNAEAHTVNLPPAPPVKFMDATNRQAPGPGAHLYRAQRR